MAVACQCLEVFRFPVMQSTFCFPNTEIITVPASSLINYFRPKGAVESVFVGEKRLVMFYNHSLFDIFTQVKMTEE